MRLRARSALTGLAGPVSLIAQSLRTDNLQPCDKFPAPRLSHQGIPCFYLARFQTKVEVPPPEATGTITFSSSPVSVNGRLCSAPVEFGNVADSMRRTSLSPSTAYVPKWALVP